MPNPTPSARSAGSAGTTLTRRVLPFAPLALSLLVGRAVFSGAAGSVAGLEGGEIRAVECEDVLGMEDCHTRYPTGCSKSGVYDPYLNLLKNQLTTPPQVVSAMQFLKPEDFAALDKRVPSGLTRRNHLDYREELAQSGEGRTVGVLGYLYYAKATGAESSNCQLDDAGEDSSVDYHLWVGSSATLATKLRSGGWAALTPAQKTEAKQTGVIVEMTPHYRDTYGRAWTLEALRAAYGRRTRVIGQLMLDNEHNIPSQNCAIAKTAKEEATCWRPSAWEIHPVMRFELCAKDSCDDRSADWVELGAETADTGPRTAPGGSS